MKPQKQLYRHGQTAMNGDCLRTCYAMILNMDRDDVPHFMEGVNMKEDMLVHEEAELVQKRIDTFLSDYGLCENQIAITAESLDQAILWCASCTRGPVILLGRTATNIGHAVVIHKGEMYDPNWCSLTQPNTDGFWWIIFITPADNWKPNIV